MAGKRIWWAAGCFAALCIGAVAPSSASAAPTVVSLTFDHGLTSHYGLRDTLAAHGAKATFYVNSGWEASTSGNPSFMSWEQMAQLYADGHEIGGHTLTHRDPGELTVEEQRYEICEDRRRLLAQGFAATSFSYPFGSNEISEAIVQGCGYNSGRRLGGLREPDCADCPIAESIPPERAFRTRASLGFDGSTELATLQEYVNRAQAAGGGWVQLVWNTYGSIPPETLDSFLAWLAAEPDTVVQTVQQVIGGTVQPVPEGSGTTPVATLPPPPPGTGLQPAIGDTVRPVIARFSVSPRVFAVGRRGTRLTARRPRLGTRFRYVVSEPGTVTVRIDRLLPGRRVGRSCRRPTRRLRNARRCNRRVRVGSLSRTTTRISNRIVFSGRLGRRPLRRGRYMALATMVDTAGNPSGRARRATFTVVPRSARRGAGRRR